MFKNSISWPAPTPWCGYELRVSPGPATLVWRSVNSREMSVGNNNSSDRIVGDIVKKRGSQIGLLNFLILSGCPEVSVVFRVPCCGRICCCFPNSLQWHVCQNSSKFHVGLCVNCRHDCRLTCKNFVATSSARFFTH
jgi:hypothetical protein